MTTTAPTSTIPDHLERRDLTYGRADTLVPAAHGDWLAAHIPGAKVVATDAAHMGDDSTVEEQFAWLAGGG